MTFKKILLTFFFVIEALIANAVNLSGYVGEMLTLQVSTKSENIYSINWSAISGPTECVRVQYYANTYGKDIALLYIDAYYTGTVRVRAFYNLVGGGSKTEYFDITCNAVNLILNPSSLDLDVGDSEYIYCTLSPTGYTPTVVYTSSNTSVAKVYQSGRDCKVTGESKGTATITVSNSMGPDVTVRVSVNGGNEPDPIDVGTYFQETTEDGTTLLYQVVNCGYSNEKCAYVTPGANGSCAVSYATSKVTIPNKVRGLNVRGMRQFALAALPNIKEIVLPSTLVFYDKWSITNCPNLSSITILAETPPITLTADIFTSTIYDNTTLYVPKGRKSAYSSALGWKKFKTIEETGGSSLPSLSAVPSGGEVEKGTVVKLYVGNSNAELYYDEVSYTLDGNDPKYSYGLHYTYKGITINKSCTLRAVGKKWNGSGYDYTNEFTTTYTVKQTNPEPISIVLPNYTETIKVGQTITLVPTITPPNATTTLTWTSSNTAVATVSQSGVVKGITVGESKITVTTSNNISAFCYVKVEQDVIYVSSISLNATSVTLTEGNSKQLEATVYPNNATNKSVTWTSNNLSVASVSSSGLVTAKASGSATITCKANDGSGVSATCSIKVESAIIQPTAITVSPSSKTIKVGETFYCYYSLTPSNATTTVTWTSDDSSIATVSSYGLVTGKSEGVTYINVKTANGKTGWCKVTVEPNIVEPTSITLPYSKTIKVDESLAMTYTLTPSNATTTLTWYSDDPSIATVSSSGVVKGIKAGSTYINVRTANGKTDWCYVTVEEAKPKLHLSASSSGGRVTKGTNVYLIVDVEDELIYDYDIYYTLNGGTPSKNSTKYMISGITINSDCIIKAIAYKEGYETSDILTATYTVREGTIEPISFSIRDSVTMNSNDTYFLVYSLGYPGSSNVADMIKPSISWLTSYEEDVVTISEGILTAVDTGTTWVFAETTNGLSASCKVTVKEPQELIKMNIKQVDLGSFHTMILETDGSLWACGTNSDGQLGDGTFIDCYTPKQIMTDVAKVAAGYAHTMILKTNGSLWACGANPFGELADGTTTLSKKPKHVMNDVADVAAGFRLTMFLKNDGSLWACGSNYRGQLGDGTTDDFYTPKQIMTNVEKMAIGYRHTLILKKDGSLWTCGGNTYGQLGDGTTTDRSTYKQIMTGVADIAAGNNHTIILKTDGSLWTCGQNKYGQLADGTTTNRYTPKKVMDNVTTMSAGYYQTIILKNDGSLWFSGENWALPNFYAINSSSTPKRVLNDVANMSAGGGSNMILKTDGSLWAFGSNGNGQLGDGTSIERQMPVQITIAGSSNVNDVLVGRDVVNSPVYSLSGQRLAAPKKGINIINGKKIVVK